MSWILIDEESWKIVCVARVRRDAVKLAKAVGDTAKNGTASPKYLLMPATDRLARQAQIGQQRWTMVPGPFGVEVADVC
jgi:hypothetical protein